MTTAASPHRHSRRVLVGAALCLVGAVVAVTFFFQPWRSCEGEDTSVGCAMLPGDAAVMQVAALVFLIGVIVAAAGVLDRPAERG
ncbi:cell division protein FtsX [Microbacterium sp. SORGH_AS 1204]|uniref:hypothetical protein n=1 Tax=Microbacterium sp. SORGH_AS_1204 TaxID=3041785 RepID=UPI00278DBAB8|nr:hypothetical protein [Microbacterium sp. SORGH_AS_1204]MDQ1137722.1 cell division protein FtsX [Microbacterium sp. SORGH_AS_1204]